MFKVSHTSVLAFIRKNWQFGGNRFPLQATTDRTWKAPTSWRVLVCVEDVNATPDYNNRRPTCLWMRFALSGQRDGQGYPEPSIFLPSTYLVRVLCSSIPISTKTTAWRIDSSHSALWTWRGSVIADVPDRESSWRRDDDVGF